MSLVLFAHPFSSYCQKVLVALYETGVAFSVRLLDPGDPATLDEFGRLWPLRRFPILVDDGQMIAESSIIIEHLQIRHPGAVRLIPEAPEAALEVRFLDRFFDTYVQTSQQKFVIDAMRAGDERDARGVADARGMLETAYDWLDRHMEGRDWAAGEGFSMADCSAAPALFYADWTHPIDARFATLRSYRSRLLARPSFARAVDEARPYRPLFPLRAPDRD